MSVYQYVADNDPKGAEYIINSFGYEVTNRKNLGQSLSELVSQVGEPALVKVMEYHPDKDIILELNSKDDKQGCSCKSCKNQHRQEHYLNVSGEETPTVTQKNDTLAHQTNAIMVIATVFIVGALFLKNK